MNIRNSMDKRMQELTDRFIIELREHADECNHAQKTKLNLIIKAFINNRDLLEDIKKSNSVNVRYNTVVQCSCGVKIKKYSLSKHLRSKKHLDKIQNQTSMFIGDIEKNTKN